MKNLIYLFTFLLLGFTACQTSPPVEDQHDTTVTGYLDNISGQEVILAQQTPDGIITIDTAIVQEDGYFLFTPNVDDMQLYRIVTGFNQFITFPLEKGDHIHVEADGVDVTGYYIEGSEEAELINEVSKEITRNSYILDSLRTEIKHLTAAKNGKALYEIFEIQKQTHEKHHEFGLQFIQKHPGTIAAYFIVSQLQLEDDADAYFLVQKELTANHPSFNFLPALDEQVGILSLANVGTLAPELSFPSPTGEITTLSSLRGKYVLIDFWASWCKPCRAENPNTKRLYDLYKSKGFEIYGYALDQDKDKWINAIEEDQIDWVHTSDLKGWDAAGSKAYGVQAIPATFLIDPNGFIMDRDLRGEELALKLEEIFE